MSRDLILTRENLLIRSEEFDTWGQSGTGSVTVDAIAAPDGMLTADLLDDTDTIADKTYWEKGVTVVDDSSHNLSFFIKENTALQTVISIFYTGGSTISRSISYIWAVGDVAANWVLTQAKDGWIRLSTAVANDSSGNTLLRLRVYPAGSSVDITGSAYVWGGQITNGGILRPYSKSGASAVTGPFAGLVITPEYDYKDTGQKFESRHRVRSGAEYVYKWGEWSEKKISVAFVNSEFKSVVNSWWASNTDLEFQEDFNVTSVHLINKSKPVDGLVKPYNDLFRGKIELGTY